MRIAWIGPVPADHGGVPGVARDILSGLLQLGHSVDCYIAASPHALPATLINQEDLGVHWSGSSWRWDRWYSRSHLLAFLSGTSSRAWGAHRLGKRLLRDHLDDPFDVIYQFSSIELFSLRRKLDRLPPLVLHPETHAQGELAWFVEEKTLAAQCESGIRLQVVRTALWVRSKVQARHIRLADHVICISEAFRGHLMKDYRVLGERTTVIPNPIDLEVFSPSEHEAGRPTRIVFVGRIAVRKGIDYVVELSRRLLDLEGEVRLELVGGHSLWSDYRPLLDGLDGRIAAYLGPLPRSEVAQFLRIADLLIQPSKFEPFGLTVGEGLASGVPVVVTEAVGAGERVDPLCCVRVAPSSADIERGVRAMLDRLRVDQSSIRAIARKEAERLFDRNSICREIADVLHRVAGLSKRSSGEPLGADVIVPTFRRPERLERCLGALEKQSLSPRNIYVIVRSDDHASAEVIRRHAQNLPSLRSVQVESPGVIAAMRCGVAASTAPLIAFTDDDAEPEPNWLESLVEAFSKNPKAGAVGGRDVIAEEPGPLTKAVGTFDRFGRLTGNHHLGEGERREVQVLKGANMAFRASALALPEDGFLRGSGAQPNFEILVCDWTRRQGWQLIYDPGIRVNHFPAAKPDSDRNKPDRSASFNAAYNFVFATRALGGRWNRVFWFATLIGSRAEPSFGRLLGAIVRREKGVFNRAVACIAGKAAASFAGIPPKVMSSANTLRSDHVVAATKES